MNVFFNQLIYIAGLTMKVFEAFNSNSISRNLNCHLKKTTLTVKKHRHRVNSSNFISIFIFLSHEKHLQNIKTSRKAYFLVANLSSKNFCKRFRSIKKAFNSFRFFCLVSCSEFHCIVFIHYSNRIRA